MVRTLARWMACAVSEILEEADYIVPVPLHRWRFFHRRYNQSALLARHVAEKAGKILVADALERVRTTSTQEHLKRKERAENVKTPLPLTRAAKLF